MPETTVTADKALRDKPMVPLTYVELPSGGFLSMRKPNPGDITLYDVAHKLAQTNRFGGSTSHPYNVAQHAVFVSERLRRRGSSRRVQLLGLHHDDPEAFLGDIPRPWKAMLGQIYADMTKVFEAAIEQALGLPETATLEHQLIKRADNYALLVEARNMLPSGGHRWDYLKDFDLPARIVTPDYYFGEQNWAVSRDTFIARHEELTNG